MDPEMMKMAMDAMSKMTPQQVSYFSCGGCVVLNPILKPLKTKGISCGQCQARFSFAVEGVKLSEQSCCEVLP